MDQQEKSYSASSFPGSVPMARIDGAKIRNLRESQGLTQLYLSTVVGVTTDTISRWENRRYPTIKLENAEKLAQALEVELQEILEQKDKEPAEEQQEEKSDPPSSPPLTGRLRRFLILTGAAALTLAVTLAWFFFLPEKPAITVSAERFLPPHVAAGQTFPVLIHVQASSQVSVSFILKEIMPEGCMATPGKPPFTTVDPKNHAVKWIARTDTGSSTFAYIVRAPVASAAQSGLRFAGSVTLKQEAGPYSAIQGGQSMTIEPYHWADRNRDNMIDDEEILAVYDRYSDIDGLQFDRDLIDNIWAGSGYEWDSQKGEYIILD